MPKYELHQLPGKPVPFYGLQDVTAIDLPAGATEEQILEMCLARCRSDHFVVIYAKTSSTLHVGCRNERGSQYGRHGGLPHFQKVALSPPWERLLRYQVIVFKYVILTGMFHAEIRPSIIRT